MDAVIALDQVEEEGCGVVTPMIVEALADRAARYPQVVFWADSRRRIRRFRHVIIKPNQLEAVGMLDADARPGDRVGATLRGRRPVARRNRRADLRHPRGGGHVGQRSGADVGARRADRGPDRSRPAPATAPRRARCWRWPPAPHLPEAALVGNLVASITVQQLATTGTASPEQLPPRLEMWRAQRGD